MDLDLYYDDTFKPTLNLAELGFTLIIYSMDFLYGYTQRLYAIFQVIERSYSVLQTS